MNTITLLSRSTIAMCALCLSLFAAPEPPQALSAAGRSTPPVMTPPEYRSVNDPAQEGQEKNRAAAEKLLAEGDRLRAQGAAEALRQALARYEAALPLWRAAGDRRSEAATLDNLGLVYSLLGENPKALDYYNQALALWRAADDRRGEAQTLSNIAFVYLNTADREKALAYFTQALPLRRAAGDRQGEGVTLNGFGVLYHGLGEDQKALDYFRQALALRREAGDRQGEAQTINNIGAIHFEIGEYQKALDYYNQALPLRRAAGDHRGEANALYNIGGVYSQLDEFRKSLEHYNQTLPIWRAAGDRRGEAITLNSIGALYSHQDDRQKALDYYNQALPLFRAISDRRGEAQALDNIAFIRARSGESQQALADFEQSLALRRAIKDRRGEAFALTGIGAVYLARGDLPKALAYHEQALALRRSIGERRPQAITLNYLGEIYAARGDAQKALDHYRQALTLWREMGSHAGEAASLAGLARVERDRGNLSEARAEIEAALDKVETLRARTTGHDTRATFFASAQNNYEFYVNLLMRLHREQPAAGYDAAAFQAGERARARNLLEAIAETRAHIRQGVDRELLERERDLQQQLNAQAERLARLPANDRRAEALKKKLQSLLTEFQEAQAQIRTRSPRYAALTQPQPLSLKEAQERVLDEHSLLLAYSLGEEQSFLWGVTRTSLHSYTLPGRKAVEAAARRVYALLTARNHRPVEETLGQKQARLRQADTEFREAAAALSRMLIAPAASELPGKRRLLIVAEGALLYLPFAALPTPTRLNNQVSSNPQSNVPLISDYEIVNLPSASVLGALRQEKARRVPPSKLLAVLADPVFQSDDPRIRRENEERATRSTTAAAPHLGEEARRAAAESGLTDFTRLRFSRREAEEIAALAPAPASLKALDFAASRDAVKDAELSQYRLLHFATHALSNNEHADLSGIVFSLVDEHGQPVDGFLRLHEIYNLRLNADLVTLSACQTALGKEMRGEGLLSLTRGFIYAGAPRVVASLWSVQDRATAELMKRFYQGLLKKGRAPAVALRAAQLEMMKDKRWSAAYYWAAFSLQGEWRP
jgi:CHAT domain-containing protein